MVEAAGTTTKITQPEWIRPTPVIQEPVLKVYNSLTRSKNEFLPANGRRVDWYNCGPTVYDAAHMGHARNYLTQDIIRRILSDYFGYEVNFVMNITDIDDKIIARAREIHLLSTYRDAHPTLTPELTSDIKAAWTAYFQSKLVKCLPASDLPAAGQEEAAFDALFAKEQTDLEWSKACKVNDEKFGLYLTSLQSAKAGLAEAKDSASLLDSAQSIMAWWLDKRDGHTISDQSIFRSLPTHWESAFFADMEALHILPPDNITRVSEYVPEIVSFVQQIVDNGFAYVTGGDVWFDVGAFEGAKHSKEKGKGKEENGEEDWTHVYAKLQPWSKGNRELLAEGEGSLVAKTGKKSPSDFALWKSAKPGEPFWQSPWGSGRPGWHIECSVMASEVLGRGMDIHSGGVDLMFPHHDNEIAQSEAYHGCRQWVNYFIHTGHLHIQGLKMSKSLKNFITIGQALETYTPRQLRLAFMSHLWSSKMDLKQGTKSDVESLEETFNNFFRNVKAKIGEHEAAASGSEPYHNYEQPEKQLIVEFQKAQQNFRAALCDSFNTPDALTALTTLVSQANIYLQSRPRPKNIQPLRTVAVWITSMLKMFGLGEGVAVNLAGAIGWGDRAKAGEAEVDREAVLMPYLRALSTFRDEVRKLALSQASPKDILELCDRLRDNELVDLGVALDDQEDGKALVKLAPAEELIKAREEKQAVAAAKVARKAAAAEAAEAQRLAKLEKGKLSPLEMFKEPHIEAGLYSAWDAEGLPTHDAEGGEVSKGKSKKLKKEWDAQVKAHDAWKASQA